MRTAPTTAQWQQRALVKRSALKVGRSSCSQRLHTAAARAARRTSLTMHTSIATTEQSPITQQLPQGCQLLPLNADTAELQQSFTTRHKFVHFGAPLQSEAQKYGLPAPQPVPSYAAALLEAAHAALKQSSLYTQPLNRLSLRYMTPGTSVKPSCEADEPAYTEPLCIVPLLSHTLIELQHTVGSHHNLTAEKPHLIHVPVNTLLVLSDPARQQYTWQISSQTRDKVNGKDVKRKDCVLCIFRHTLPLDQQPALPASDSKNAGKKVVAESVDTSTTTIDESFEQQHVHNVYDSIASHFSATRHTPWPRIDSFVRNLSAGTRIADVGCGNGKYMGLNPAATFDGCDLSEPLVQICRQRGYNVVVGDALRVPFESDTYDVALSIAVLHHLSTVDRRMKAISELLRIAKPATGRVLISAWALEQDARSRRVFPTQDVMVPWGVPKHHIKASDPATDSKSAEDELASTDTETVTVNRYCHVYKEGELEGLCSAVGGCTVIDRYYDRGNWCVLLQKL